MYRQEGSPVFGVVVALVALVVIGALVFWAVTDEGTPELDVPEPTPSPSSPG